MARLRGLHRFRRNRGAVVGLGLVGLVLLFAALGPLFSSHDPFASDFAHGVDPVTGLPVGPSSRFWLGTDRLFRDQLARLAMGARLSLLIGVAATAISTLIGAAVGIVAGWFEGERPFHLDVDGILMRAVDVGLSFPFLLLVMALGAAIEQTTSLTILLVLGLTGWLGTARIVRAKTLTVRRLLFVDAARALGGTTPRILLRHVLPNVVGPIVVIATAQVAQMILAESVLSFLGAGVMPPTPTWGGMLSDGQEVFTAAPWLVFVPAGAILLTVLGWNLVGEGLRDALDPREQP
ncbi:MAG: ABC transporter permease [Myxococcales bacterium]|nr:ABC transporter permease [Myxococcales bacterium]